MNSLDSVTSNLILFYISKLDGALGKTHLQKMLFLTDLISTKQLGSPITNMEYKRYLHGPYSKKLDEYVEELEKKKLIIAKELNFISSQDKKYFRFHITKSNSSEDYLKEKLSPEQISLIYEILNSYGNMSLQQVLDVVYNLEIIKDSEMNKPLEFVKNSKSEDPEEPHEETIL